MTPQESIQPVNNSYEPGRAEMAILPQRAQAESPAPVAKEKSIGNEKPAANEKLGAHEAKVSSAAGGSPWNIRMRFEVEPETQQVTVFIIDKQSQKVIRTIPADQLEKMQQGDLLELFI
jgi:uncharacterized FlaG/YvyC family protein